MTQPDTNPQPPATLTAAERYAIRGGLTPDEYLSWLRQQQFLRGLTLDELKEVVRCKRDHVQSVGVGLQAAKPPKVSKAKAAKAKINIDDLFADLEKL